MNIVQFAIFKENGSEKTTWEVTLSSQKTLVGTLEAFNGGVYVLNDGRNHYFNADQVVSIVRY